MPTTTPPRNNNYFVLLLLLSRRASIHPSSLPHFIEENHFIYLPPLCLYITSTYLLTIYYYLYTTHTHTLFLDVLLHLPKCFWQWSLILSPFSSSSPLLAPSLLQVTLPLTWIYIHTNKLNWDWKLFFLNIFFSPLLSSQLLNEDNALNILNLISFRYIMYSLRCVYRRKEGRRRMKAKCGKCLQIKIRWRKKKLKYKIVKKEENFLEKYQ